VVVDELIFSFI